MSRTPDHLELSDHERIRYSRHLRLKGIGPEGQLKLKNARVLLVGAGGLGAPVGMYLAAAGIGRLGVVDFDRVDETNLQRQVLFISHDVGRSKAVTAARRLSDLNPLIEITPHDLELTASNAL